MKKKIVILTSPSSELSDSIKLKKLGIIVTEISELYQTVKESEIDLILVDEARTDFKRAVANRIRRFNGLTEIWKISSESYDLDEDSYIDGSFSVDLGDNGIVSKVKQILKTKELLKQYKIIGRSSHIKMIAETIDRIAPTDVPVLIVGPSGSGKELVAQALHDNSTRSGETFMAINCGAIAEGLLESELFGHEKGAFTGSVSKRVGLFEKAGNGTVFLDEIGETTPAMQVKLLRVLEDGTFYPVGSSTVKHSNIRLLSATNRDLNEAISERKFREDLYFRIGVVKVILSPLYERKGDIQPLLQFFWREQKHLSYTDSALEMLEKYDWPGNIRQLKNFADRMIAIKPKGAVNNKDVEQFLDEQHANVHNLPVSTGKTSEEVGQELIYHAILSLGNEIKLLRDLITSHLPGETTAGSLSDDFENAESLKDMTVDEMEKIMIRQVLTETRGNRKEAARRLGIGERTLYRKLNKYKLT
jgi:DNA-binding NtrC family response regulator